LKEIKELLEEQLVLFQSEKEEFIQERSLLETIEIQKHDEEIQQLKIQSASYQEQKESAEESFVEEIKELQSATDKDGKKEEALMLKIENLMRSKDNLILQDDIYGDIIIDNPLILKIIKTHQFQRLKDIKKLGYIYQNISKSTYSRLEHSIGMYYLAGEYVKQLQRRQPELNITESDVLCVQIAALCYNLGHGPFSHIFGLFLKEVFQSGNKPWEKVSEASVMMFDHMIEENDDVKNLLKEFLDNYEADIEFIQELIHGARTGQRKGKEFLYEIVVNKTSGLDVCMIDDTTRDAAVLGMNINFKWRVFLSKVEVRNENGEQRIFFQKDDLETYNDLFKTRHSLHRELYYLRKNRIIAIMIKRILVKSDEKPIIRNGD
uniref:Uncharacterized protein n=1 Tax=Amphimedon queenslandica TaxID=400682 RepID=A0A1X7SUL7_AMPQE